MAVDQNLRITIRNSFNKTLLKRQKLSEEAIEHLIDLHVSKHSICKSMEKASVACDKSTLRKLAAKVTDIEYLIQATWGFKQESRFHKPWTLPGCSCPVFDNVNLYPSDSYIHLSTCSIHGSKCK